MANIGSVLAESIGEIIRDVFTFRTAKSLLIAAHSENESGVLETILFSDDMIMQYSDNTLVEW